MKTYKLQVLFADGSSGWVESVDEETAEKIRHRTAGQDVQVIYVHKKLGSAFSIDFRTVVFFILELEEGEA